MIVKHNENFFIQFDTVYSLGEMNLGVLNFWINDKCYPGTGINLTLSSLFFTLRSNLLEISNLSIDIGNIPMEEIDFKNFEDDRLVWLDTGELFQLGFSLVIGFNHDCERIFYSINYEKNYYEIVLPKGTLKHTLESLG